MECIKIDQNPIVESNLSKLEMVAEIERLKQENEKLKCNNDLLHNMLQEKFEIENMNKEYEAVAKEGFESMEDIETAYANWGYFYEDDIVNA